MTSVEDSTLHNVIDEESYTTSNRDFGNIAGKNGFIGKSTTEFNIGEQRKYKLNYLDPNSNNLCYIDPPRDSGNPVIDSIANFAYSHGVEPKMFCTQDQ